MELINIVSTRYGERMRRRYEGAGYNGVIRGEETGAAVGRRGRGDDTAR